MLVPSPHSRLAKVILTINMRETNALKRNLTNWTTFLPRLIASVFLACEIHASCTSSVRIADESTHYLIMHFQKYIYRMRYHFSYQKWKKCDLNELSCLKHWYIEGITWEIDIYIFLYAETTAIHYFFNLVVPVDKGILCIGIFAKLSIYWFS